MKLAIVAGIAAVASAVPEDLSSYSFEKFLVEFEKSYGASEIELRRNIFETRLAGIIAWNADKSNTWTKGINKFSDLTTDEFKAYLGYKRMSSMQAPEEKEIDTSSFADSVDWRTKGVVTPVKNQGGCGSCWAFAATETIESHLAIATGKLMTLSEQDMVSCTPNPKHCGGTGGCQGATAELGYAYVQDKGISSESTEPYRGITGTCKQKAKAATIGGYTKLPSNKFAPLMDAITNVGPIAISVGAEPWQEYRSGVFNGCGKGADIDHGVQLVGYGSDNGKDYWLVRNSWGGSWGEEGFIRIERFGSDDAYCGTDSTADDGTACEGDPTSVTVCGMCGILYDTAYPTNATLV